MEWTGDGVETRAFGKGQSAGSWVLGCGHQLSRHPQYPVTWPQALAELQLGLRGVVSMDVIE
jgi:hypothetical protein